MPRTKQGATPLAGAAGAVQLTKRTRGVKRSSAPLLPPLMEAARMAQYKRQYARARGRTGAIRASLCTTCEAYLKLAGAPLYPYDRGYVRLVRLLTETHLQAMLRAAEPRRPDARSVELKSIFQLLELMAREYVAAVQGSGDVLYAYPVPVETFRPVKKYCAERNKYEANVGATRKSVERFRDELPRTGRSAFSSVSSSEATDETNEADSDCVSPSQDVVSETDDDGAGSVDYSYSDDDDDLDALERCRADGKNLAQCQCNACVLGKEES